MSAPAATPRTMLAPPADQVRRHVALRRMLLLGGLYLGVRAAGIGLLIGMQLANHRPVTLQAWDGYWYTAIVQHGYRGVPTSMTDAFGHYRPDNAMVFFPGYPAVVHVVSLLGIPALSAAVAVSILAGLAATYGFARLARRLADSPHVEWVAVVLLAAAPMSIVYSMAYPESLLVALAAWALVAILEHRWWLAAPLIALAGLVSPMAAPLIVVGMAACLVDLYRARAGWASVAALTVMPLGMVGYLAWVQDHAGVSYFAVQRAGWGSGFDGGWSTLRWVGTTLGTDGGVFTLGTAVGALAAVVGVVLAVRRRWPWQVCAYCAGVVVLTWGTDSILWDKVRLLLAAFPLLVLVAVRLTRGSRTAAVVGVAVVVLAGLWFSAESLAVWRFSI